MRQNRAVELGTGLFVLLGMGALFFLTTQTRLDRVNIRIRKVVATRRLCRKKK